jgi:hypothetical protein
MASTLSDTVRFDPRRVRIPVLPIEDQRPPVQPSTVWPT